MAKQPTQLPAKKVTTSKKSTKKAPKKKTAAKKKTTSKTGTSKGSKSVSHTASLYCDPQILPEEFVTSIRTLEKVLDLDEIWLFAHAGSQTITRIHPGIHKVFTLSKNLMSGKKIGLVVDSNGGHGETAYRIAQLLRRQCGAFTAIVPRMAKSAATLMVLGAESIILGEDADLGPLDAQYPDFDFEEDMVSALDTVQAIEQLEQTASGVAINMLKYLQVRTRKKYNLLLEHALHFAADITKPLFEKVDAVRYTRQSRILKEAQDYAERLLQPKFTKEQARVIAKDMTTNYPTHEFVIDFEEAKRIGVAFDEDSQQEKPPIGLHVVRPPADAVASLEYLYHNIGNFTTFGKIIESKE